MKLFIDHYDTVIAKSGLYRGQVNQYNSANRLLYGRYIMNTLLGMVYV